MHTTFDYVNKTGEVITVVGEIVDNSPNMPKEKFVTIKLDVPHKGRPYMVCDIIRIQPMALAVAS